MTVFGLIERIYRLLLRLYPGRFRKRYGRAMAHMFRLRYGRAAAAGRGAAMIYVAGALWDLIRTAARERLDDVQPRVINPRRHDHTFAQEQTVMFLTSATTDVRQAVRVLLRAPKGTTALAVLTLALGIGANTAIFSVIHHVMISPLPYPGAERVAIAWRKNPRMADVSISPSRSDAAAWRSSGYIEGVASYSTTPLIVTGGSEPEAVDGAAIDAQLLDFTGTPVLHGRGFTLADTADSESGKKAILSHGYWSQRFGKDPGVVGRRIEINDASHEIVGVLPRAFRLPMTDADVLIPLTPPAPPDKGARPARESVSVLVRLKPGTSVPTVTEQLAGATPEGAAHMKGWGVTLMPVRDLAGHTFQESLLVLFGAVGCVLLIACANVAHLVLARNAARRREIAVRLALGASTGRLVRQLVLESLMLALVGGAAGLAIGLWGVQAISALRPPELRQLANIGINAPVFGFSFAVAVLTGLTFGVLPAWSAARGATADNLKQGGPTMSGRRGTLARRAIMVAEISLALILLAGSGLLLRSYARVLLADRGFKTDGLLAVKIDLPETRYPSFRAQADFFQSVAAGVRQTAGVKRVVLASGVPPAGGLIFGELDVEGRQPPKGGAVFGGGFVQAGFFESLRIPLIAGRTFTEADGSASVAIVNAKTAQQYWQGDAIGKRLRLGTTGRWHTIVGVVGDIRTDHDAGSIQLYFPMAHTAPSSDTTLLVVSDGAPESLIAPIKAAIWAIDSKLPLDGVEPLNQAVRQQTARPRFQVVLLTVFAAIGLLLALIGVYGIVNYSVGLRTREIGVRMALGALPTVVARNIVRETLLLAAVGIAFGLAGALAAAQTMRNLLFEVSPNDPVTLVVVAVLLAATAVIAALLPARRAMRVDPIVALRME